MKLFHTTRHDENSFQYQRKDDYQSRETCPFFENLIKNLSNDKFGFDIKNSLYAYSDITEYSNYQFGDNVFKVELNQPYRAFVCPNIQDLVLDFRIGTGFLTNFIDHELGYLTGGMRSSIDIPENIIDKYKNGDMFNFQTEDNILHFLNEVEEHFNSEFSGLGNELVETCHSMFESKKQRVIEQYIPNVKEISLPYEGPEEILVVTQSARLEKVFQWLPKPEIKQNTINDLDFIPKETPMEKEIKNKFKSTLSFS